MNRTPEPEFLVREIIDAIHEEQINTYGGLRGVRDENGLESAMAAAQNVHHYGVGDISKLPRLMPTTLRKAKRIWTVTRERARRRLLYSSKDAVRIAPSCQISPASGGAGLNRL